MTATITDASTKTIEDKIVALALIKAAEEGLAKKKILLNKELMALLEESGQSAVETETPTGGTVKVTKVDVERVKTDFDELKARLKPEQWETIVTEAVDSGKLEAAVKLGTIDPNVVADVSTVSVSSHIRLTGKYVPPALADMDTEEGVVAATSAAYGIETTSGGNGRLKPAAARAAAKAKVKKPATK